MIHPTVENIKELNIKLNHITSPRKAPSVQFVQARLDSRMALGILLENDPKNIIVLTPFKYSSMDASNLYLADGRLNDRYYFIASTGYGTRSVVVVDLNAHSEVIHMAKTFKADAVADYMRGSSNLMSIEEPLTQESSTFDDVVEYSLGGEEGPSPLFLCTEHNDYHSLRRFLFDAKFADSDGHMSTDSGAPALVGWDEAFELEPLATSKNPISYKPAVKDSYILYKYIFERDGRKCVIAKDGYGRYTLLDLHARPALLDVDGSQRFAKYITAVGASMKMHDFKDSKMTLVIMPDEALIPVYANIQRGVRNSVQVDTLNSGESGYVDFEGFVKSFD